MKIFGISIALVLFFSYVFFKRNNDLKNINDDLKTYFKELTGDESK